MEIGDYGWLDKRFGDALQWAVQQYGAREAVVHGERRLSYAQLVGRVHDFARGLLDLGVQRGDRIALWMSDSIEWLVARWAVPAIGAILVPVNTRFRANDVRYVLEQSDTQLLIFERGAQGVDYTDILRQIVGDYDTQPSAAWRMAALPALRGVIGLGGGMPGSVLPFEATEARGAARRDDGALVERLAQVQAGDVAQILYTSGTTSFPKGAMVCHGPLLQNNFNTLARMKLTSADRYLSSVPLFSATGTGYTLSMTLAGATLVLMDRFHPREFCALVQRERVTVSFFVDAIVQDLKAFDERDRYDLSSLRSGTGAPLSTDSFYFATRELKIPELIGVFGMSETSNAITRCYCDEPLEVRATTNGRPMPGVHIRVVDVDNEEVLPPGTIGEIRVSGFMIMKGYYKLPQETGKTFDAAGWLRTGDLGELTEQGHLVYRGRLKEMIKPGGFNVSTQEIEAFLRSFDGVHEAAVVGVADERLGEVAYAFVQVRAGRQVDVPALLAHCRANIASYKVPRYVEFVTEWPRTGSEKIKKLELKERAAARIAARLEDTDA